MAEKQYNSSVWDGFIKIAEESGLITTDLNPGQKDFVGNPSKSPIGPFRDNGGVREKGDNELYYVTKETGEELVEKAHPKTIQIADAMGTGGVVENQVEQQQKSLDVATKMPSGALYGIHAKLIKELTKKANDFEEQGKVKEAMRVDLAIKRIAELPFSHRQAIIKEALWPALILVGLSALTGAGAAANMGFFSSRREKLPTDLKDLQKVLKTAASESPSSQKALSLLTPFVPKFQNLSFKNNEDIIAFTEKLAEFKPVLSQIASLVARVELELGESRWFEFGMDRASRIKAKFEDIVENIKFMEKRLQKISDIGTQVLTHKKLPSQVPKLQDILLKHRLLDRPTGALDAETISATTKLEEQIDKDLDMLGVKRRSSFAGKILSNGKIRINLDKLQRILFLIQMAKEKGKTK